MTGGIMSGVGGRWSRPRTPHQASAVGVGPVMASQESITRVWSRVDASADPDECWLWTGSRAQDGYGQIKFDGKYWRAHRLVKWLTTGDLPEVVMHLCDNPLCCNPYHLKSGTTLDNVRDCIAKGRRAKRYRRKEFCVRGHLQTPLNQRERMRGNHYIRECKNCAIERQRENRRRRREQHQQEPAG